MITSVSRLKHLFGQIEFNDVFQNFKELNVGDIMLIYLHFKHNIDIVIILLL